MLEITCCMMSNSEFHKFGIDGQPEKLDSLEDAVRAARKYDSLCVPAHIFRSFGLITQLGIPPEIEFDGVEVKNPREYETAKKLGFSRFLFGMDAHTPDELEGIACTVETEKRDFEHLKTALYKGKVFPLWQH